MDTLKRPKPTREIMRAVNARAFELSRVHYSTIRARLLVDVLAALEARREWLPALEQAAHQFTTTERT